jgi:hypothetical protein
MMMKIPKIEKHSSTKRIEILRAYMAEVFYEPTGEKAESYKFHED